MGVGIVEEKWFDILVCPQCRGRTRVQKGSIDCTACNRAYPIIKGIPNLLIGDSPQVAKRVASERELYQRMHLASSSPSLEIWNASKERTRSIILRYAKDMACKTILYLGSGRDDLHLAFDSRETKFVNVDIVFEALDELHAQGARYCVCCDARDLPFVEDSFDMILCIDILHHLFADDLPQIIARLAGVLRKQGVIVIQEPNKYALLRLPICWVPHRMRLFLRNVKMRLSNRPVGPAPHESPLSAGQLISLLRRFGIECLDRPICLEYPGSRWLTAMFRRLPRILFTIPRMFGYHFVIAGVRAPVET